MRAIRRMRPFIAAGIVAFMPLTDSGAAAMPVTATATAIATTTMAIDTGGRAAGPMTPGMRLAVTVQMLPAARHAYCLGLASTIDRYSLPVSLGRITRDVNGVGRVATTIPLRIFPAEPAGPFLLFVGTCTLIAPDRPFLARTIITIVPAHTVRAIAPASHA